MAPLVDPTRLAAYKDALANWAFEGFVQFELTATAYAWIKREFTSVTLREISRLMHECVDAGGEIDEVRETRPQWADYEFHYDLRFTILDKPVYLETRLDFTLPLVPDNSTIVVVNIHAP